MVKRAARLVPLEYRGLTPVLGCHVETVNLSEELIEEAKAITGKRTPQAAIKALIGLRYVPNMLRESEVDKPRDRNRRGDIH